MDAFFNNILRNFENSWNKRAGGTAVEKAYLGCNALIIIYFNLLL